MVVTRPWGAHAAMVAVMIAMALNHSTLTLLIAMTIGVTLLFLLTNGPDGARPPGLMLLDLAMMSLLSLLMLPWYPALPAGQPMEMPMSGHSGLTMSGSPVTIMATVLLACWGAGHLAIVRRGGARAADRAISLGMIGTSAAMFAGLL